MKRLMACCLCGIIGVCAVGCGSSENVYSVGGTVMTNKAGFDTVAISEWKEDNGYSVETATVPIWNTKNVYNETVSFVGKNDEATLFYAPTKIHKVYDYYFNEEYVEGVDFTVSGNKIKLTGNRKIRYWSESTFYSSVDPMRFGVSLPIERNGETFYLPYSEVFANRYQICVSYEHDGKWTGAVPVGQGEKLPKTLEKLNGGKALNIVVIGDSISVGGGASELLKDHQQIADLSSNPYSKVSPSYINIVKDYLDVKYPSANVNMENVSVGGMDSSWGAGEGVKAVTTIPDLAVIAFGMNDSGKSVSNYSYHIESIIKSMREKNPECELVLIATMLPNPDVVGWAGNIPYFEAELVKLADKYTGSVVVPMTTISGSIYSMGKRFHDINSNNINHPNDFLHKIYA